MRENQNDILHELVIRRVWAQRAIFIAEPEKKLCLTRYLRERETPLSFYSKGVFTLNNEIRDLKSTQYIFLE